MHQCEHLFSFHSTHPSVWRTSRPQRENFREANFQCTVRLPWEMCKAWMWQLPHQPSDIFPTEMWLLPEQGDRNAWWKENSHTNVSSTKESLVIRSCELEQGKYHHSTHENNVRCPPEISVLCIYYRFSVLKILHIFNEYNTSSFPAVLSLGMFYLCNVVLFVAFT